MVRTSVFLTLPVIKDMKKGIDSDLLPVANEAQDSNRTKDISNNEEK